MGLVQVSTATVTSAVASITLTGIDSDNTYMIYMNNVISASDNKDLYMQYIKASDSSPDSASNYDYATKGMLSSGSYQNNYNTDESQYIIQYARGNATGEQDNNILCLFNTFLSSEYSYITIEGSGLNASGVNASERGGGMHTVAQSNSGVKFSWESGGNFTSATCTLYKVT